MAKTAINTIKSWFETGDFPTQEQFWNWLDSFWHKDDQLGISNIDQLDSILNSKATTEEIDSLQEQINNISAGGEPVTITATENYKYTIPAGKVLEKIWVDPSADLTGFGLGTGEGGFDIYPAMPISEADPDSGMIVLNLPAKEDRVIWLNGITAETTIKIYLR